MSEWIECTLDDIVKSANTGLDAIKRAPIVEKDTGMKCLRIQDVSQTKDFENWGFTEVEDKNFKKFQLLKNDILIARTGGSIGVNIFIKENLPSVFNNGLIRLRPNNKTLATFVYYNLRTTRYKAFIESISGGTSTQPNMKINALLSMDILLPPLEEQKAIAEVLSSLDDRIDLLHRQNKTLEVLAQTLFRQWFIEEAKDEWETGKLPDEFDFTMGLSPKGETFNEDKIGTPMYQGNADFEFRFPKNRVYTTDPKRYAEKFNTLISVRAPVGAQNMAKEKCCIGRGIASFRYKNDNSFYTYTYFKMKSLMDKIKQFNDSGTVFGSINKTDFQDMEVTIPPNDLVVKYQNEVKSLDDKVIQNTFQIQTLENMRDTLLPKLMSGKVKIQQKEDICK